jgi:glyoxylase-like metal-dependent hydrolase (beta-lactamase superfamily II)
MEDGDEVLLGNRTLGFMDTPGHARHHFCVWDSETMGWFSGDTFGISYRELDTENGPFIFPTTTPIEFDPPALKNSVNRLLEKSPQWMYLTHYGRVGGVLELAPQLLSAIDAMVEMAERCEHQEERSRHFQRDFAEWLFDSARSHGVNMPDGALRDLLQPDIELNTQGVDIWLTRRRKLRDQS